MIRSKRTPPRKGAFWNLNRVRDQRAERAQRRELQAWARRNEELNVLVQVRRAQEAQRRARILQKLSRGTGEVSDEVRRDALRGLYYEKTEPEGGFPWGVFWAFCAGAPLVGYLLVLLLIAAGVL